MILGRIEFNPLVCNGKPVIRGTRIPVTVILDHLVDGSSWESILEDFPGLTREDIAAAIGYARHSIDQTEIEWLEENEILSELRAIRADLDRKYPSFQELYEYIKSREKEYADRLVNLGSVPLNKKPEV